MLNELEQRAGAINTIADASLVVFTGTGKSFRLAELAADLLQATGIPAVAISSSDLLHGSLNVFMKHKFAAVVAISHSGNTQETIAAVELVSDATDIICITGVGDSKLTALADVRLAYYIGTDDDPRRSAVRASFGQLEIISILVNYFADQLTVEEAAKGHPGGTLYAK